MNIKSIETRKVTPLQLTEALASSTPKEFADVWFKFHELCDRGNVDLYSYAEAMSEELGANRQRPIRTLVEYMDYFTVKKRIKDNEAH